MFQLYVHANIENIFLLGIKIRIRLLKPDRIRTISNTEFGKKNNTESGKKTPNPAKKTPHPAKKPNPAKKKPNPEKKHRIRQRSSCYEL